MHNKKIMSATDFERPFTWSYV